MPIQRRTLLLGSLVASVSRAQAQDDAVAVRALRAGGIVAVFRHANAPGVYDPEDMRLDDCSTQRNLDGEGRAQAVRLGTWFSSRSMRPAAVRSSPWCRCLDTARGAFGAAQAWPLLGSPRRSDAPARADQVRQLKAEVALLRQRGGFEVWVTHNFVIADVCGVSTASAEGVLLRAEPGGEVAVVARIGPV